MFKKYVLLLLLIMGSLHVNAQQDTGKLFFEHLTTEDGLAHNYILSIFQDEDGFIFIKGRLSRFSKIGGEMVPHMSVEDSIIRALGIQDSEKPLIAIGSKIDPAKGEALILLSAVDIDMPQLRRLLTEAGLPNLWIPKHAVRVDAIPVLATGKLDLGSIHKICASCE